MPEVSPSPRSEDLQRLRRRLYAPDATPADQVRYAEELARTRRAEADGEALPSGTGSERAARAVTTAGRGRVRLLAVSGVALVVGLALGALVTLVTLVTLEVPRSTDGQPLPSPPPASARPLAVPRPLAATALGSSAQRRNDEQALARALRLSSSAARRQAMLSVGRRTSLQADRAWMERTGCSASTGTRTSSLTGLRSDLQRGAQGAQPYGTHFRVQIFLAEPAGWSWVAYGRTDDGGEGVIALGAGSSGAGSSQFTEFDTPSATTITSVDVRSSPATPFVWELGSCSST